MDATPAKVMPSIAQFYFVRAMYTHNGVYRMSAG
jgi:dipeptidase D